MIAVLGDVGVNWTDVLVVGVPAWLGGIAAILAAVYSGRNSRKLRTSNGTTVGEAVEQTHALVKEGVDVAHELAAEQSEKPPESPGALA